MRLAAVLCAGLLLSVGPGGQGLAAPVTISERPEATALTIYPDQGYRPWEDDGYEPYNDGQTGLAMITEWRTIEVPAGETVLTFRGVADGIVPQTAALQDLPARLVEANQDYDLLSPGSLIARSLGARVRRVRTDPVTGRETVEDAVIRSGPFGTMLEVDGKFEALGCGGPPERLVFERAPEGLTDKPTLSMRVRVKEAGRYRVRLSYLTVGLLWSANYVAQVRDDGRMHLTGWITLKNLGSTTFADAPTQFVAGEVEETGETNATVVRPTPVVANCWPMDTTGGRRPPPPPPPPPPPAMAPPADVEAVVVTASRMAGVMQDVPIAVMAMESDLGDYKLYSLPVPVTVAAKQTKQVMMLDREGVSFDRVYRYRVGSHSKWEVDTVEAAHLLLRTKNTKASGLGIALPIGRVALMETAPGGRLMLAGRETLNSTPVGSPLEIEAGEIESIEVQPRRVRDWTRGKRNLTEFELVVTNHRATPVAFEAVHNEDGLPTKVVAQTLRHEKKPAGFTWALDLAPGEQTVLRYTIERRPPQPKKAKK